MLRIAICDDEQIFREKVKEYVEQYLIERDMSYELDEFSSGKEFLGLGTERLRYSIVFLDINMDEIDGIMTAKKIREYSSEVYIVFVTAYIDYSLEGYKVDAARYLLKGCDNFDESIYECMDTILDKMNYTVAKKVFKFNEGEKEISLERILYIESRLHKLEFHVMEEKMTFYSLYGTLNDLEKDMEGLNFLRVHQSFLVNLKHVKQVTNYKVVLSNNEELTIPKSRYKDVKNAFIAYKGELW